MAAVSTMVIASLVSLGEREIGGTLTSAEGTHYINKMNTLLESWNLERLMCYQITQNSLALTASTSTYTIGTNGTFAVTRPNKIVDPCYIRDNSGYDTPITIIDVEAYGRIVDKDAGFTTPKYLYYDHGFSATSTGTIFLYPSPSASLTLYINSWSQLTAVSTLSHNILMPSGYQRMLETNFALECAPGLVDPSPALVKAARESKAAVGGLNIPSLNMRLDTAVSPVYGRNIFTGP